jgi:NAD(P)H-dependent FMN reductase
MIKVGIIVGSTRPGRKGRAIADWVYGIASERLDAEFELLDIADFGLPLLDEPLPPLMGEYAHDHTRAWAARIDSCDAFVFVTPEYNHSTSAALKNAIDYLFREWNNKAAGFVGYGRTDGARAVEHLRQIMGEIMVADVRVHVGLSLHTDFENSSVFKPAGSQAARVNVMLDQVVAWGGALRTLRRGVRARTPERGVRTANRGRSSNGLRPIEKSA